MTPQTLLDHYDNGQLWAGPASAAVGFDLRAAYQSALAVRALRMARGELPRGYKIGFTNPGIWSRYNVFAPIWGSVWNTTLGFCEILGSVPLAGTCQPRIEPEVVFAMKSTPASNASFDDLFDAIDWVAPGFEIVQSHLGDWKFAAPDAVADGGLHARLLVGRTVPAGAIATSAGQLDALLATARVSLLNGDEVVEQGQGSNVLGGPLRALHAFLAELRQCAGAPDLMPGDVVTTGTWTDAWPVRRGERWSAQFSAPLSNLQVEFS